MRKTEFLKGSVELAVLGLLATGDKYGYQITQALKETPDEILSISEGTLYPMLHRMEAAGYVRGRWEKATGRRRIRFYALTAKGRQELKERTAYWKSVVKAITRLLN